MSALANGLSCLNVSDLVGRRVRAGTLKLSGGLPLNEGLEDIRANFKSNDDVTGGEVASGDNAILESPPVMGMFPDMIILFGIELTDTRCDAEVVLTEWIVRNKN